MPIHEYKCSKGHVFEKFFKTFKEAGRERKGTALECPTCHGPALRVEFSVPRPAHFYGNPEGYDRPSPLKRYSTKLVSQKEGNSSAGG